MRAPEAPTPWRLAPGLIARDAVSVLVARLNDTAVLSVVSEGDVVACLHLTADAARHLAAMLDARPNR